MGFIYFGIKTFCKGVLKIYFRKIYVIGEENIPQDGPVIICGNHANQFIDPMMIISHCDREISFTMAASSYSKPVIGQFAKSLNVIPVARPEDSKKKGLGKVVFLSSTELKGLESKFAEEVATHFKSGISALVIKGKTFLVEKIIDNEKIILKENKEDYDTVCNGEHEFFILPKIDNSILFKEVYRRLGDDGCICIFPEGTSHDRTEFIKLKAGIALMALGAMSEHKCKNIKIVPVGLNYYKREEFRSEVVIEFGKPFEVPSEWADDFKINKRDATEKLLKEIEARMKSVTLTAPSFKELRSLFLVRKLYVPQDAKLTSTQYNELCKRFSKGYEKLKDREDTQGLLKKVNRYINELESTGLNDREVKKIDFNYVWIVRKTFWSVLFFHIFLVLCLPAIFILSPFAYLVKKKAEKERILAKAKNPNKIEALDVVSSVKVIYSILYMPFIFLIWSLLFFYCFNKYINHKFFDLSYFFTFVLSCIIFPIYLYSAARMLDYIAFYLQTILSRFLYFINPKNITKLKASRELLAKEILEFVNVHIKEADPKYENERILFKKEIDRGDTEKEIMIRRNSTRRSKKSITEGVSDLLSQTS